MASAAVSCTISAQHFFDTAMAIQRTPSSHPCPFYDAPVIIAGAAVQIAGVCVCKRAGVRVRASVQYFYRRKFAKVESSPFSSDVVLPSTRVPLASLSHPSLPPSLSVKLPFFRSFSLFFPFFPAELQPPQAEHSRLSIILVRSLSPSPFQLLSTSPPSPGSRRFQHRHSDQNLTALLLLESASGIHRFVRHVFFYASLQSLI